MQNMRKLKEDALRRKQEFEEKQRNDEFKKQRKMSGGRSSRSDKRRPSKGRGSSAQDQRRKAVPARTQVRKKAKKTPGRWVIDTLLVVGTLMALVALFNPY
ncbi:hypothetical protein [Oceanospirillum sp.]|uniref:hypothetical protein n=1 Tax=Oceanospirillum sp. TaxID=2021254 RepID=UPI003A939433